MSAFWGSSHDTIVKHGQGGLCRWCEAAHEGTIGHTLAHWRECVGIATYSRAVAMGVDRATALRLATWMYRDFPTAADKAHDWPVRDYATRAGLVPKDDRIEVQS